MFAIQLISKMLCRLCVIECNDFLNIFEKEGLQWELPMLISRYLHIQVAKDDEHSASVCQSCLDTLREFDSFCKSVESAQKKWEIIPNLNVIEEGDNSEECSTREHETTKLESGVKACEKNAWNKCEDAYMDHDRDVADEAILSENVCKKEKSRKTLLSKEINQLIESYTKLFCNECNETMASFKDLKQHFKSDHAKAGYMVCCKRKFFRAADLADHINIHLNPEYFRCDQCDKSFSSRYSLVFHRKTSHVQDESEKKYFYCIECPKKFLRKCVLEKHKLTHKTQTVDSSENTHICSECGKGYATESKLKAHHFNVHTLIYSRICHVCGKIVRGNKALELHQLEHAGLKQKVKCEICEVELSTKGILKAHMIALHPEDTSETHVCSMCGKSAPSKRALKYHMDYVHKTERSHVCNLCDKSFKKLQALKEHMTTHTGDRLYECPHCMKTFKVRSNMHQHRKAKHPKEFEESRKNRTGKR